MGSRHRRTALFPGYRGAVLTALLFDTNVLIDARRDVFDLDALIADDDEPAVAAITVAELGVGVEIASGRRRATRKSFLDEIVASLPIVAYDLDVARAHTALLVAVRKHGTPKGAHDLIIAATARATNRTVVTSDRTGFIDLPGVNVRHPV